MLEPLTLDLIKTLFRPSLLKIRRCGYRFLLLEPGNVGSSEMRKVQAGFYPCIIENVHNQ